MVKVALASAVATGVFCAGFAVFIDLVTEALPMATVISLSFASGFLGSLFARLVLREYRGGDR